MNLPDDILVDLQRLGRDAERYSLIAEREGIEFLRRFVAKLVSSARLFDEWFPRLTAFATSKRIETPIPSEDSLSPIERAWIRILEPKIVAAEHVPVGDARTAVIFIAPLPVLGIVRAHWPGQVANAVFLTPSESAEWHSLYEHDVNAFWWFAYQWWGITEQIDESSIWFFDRTPQIPSGIVPWVVTWGLQWGDLAGGENAELWGWSGVHEHLIEELGVCDF